jgi:DNA-binding beta-propeller fold protein YncE
MRIRGVVAVLISAFALVVGSGVAQASVPIQTVVSFNPTAGEFPEGVAVSVTGTAYVSLVNPVAEIRTIDRSGAQSVVTHFSVPGLGPLGLAVDASGRLFADVSTLDPATRGVYRVRADGSSSRLPGTGAIQFPNGLALDPRGTLYVTDSIGGAVWKIARGGSAQLWFQSPLLTGTGAFGLGFPLGANGIAVQKQAVIVSNTERARIVRIPIRHNGAAGTAAVIAEGPALFGSDGVAVDVFGNVYDAVNSQSTLVRVSRGGSLSTLATAADGLDNPASLAWGTSRGDRKSLFITNFAIFSASPTPGLLKAAMGVPGQPLP